MTKSGQLSVAAHIIVPDLTNSSVKYKTVADHTIQIHTKKGVVAIQCKNKQKDVSSFEETIKTLTTSQTNGRDSMGSNNSLDLDNPLKIDGPYKSPVSRKASIKKQSTLKRGATIEHSDSSTVTLKMVMSKLEIIDAKLDTLLGSSGNRGRKNN